MFLKFFVFFLSFLNCKVINLSDFKFCGIESIIKIVGKQEKTVQEQVINNYIDTCVFSLQDNLSNLFAKEAGFLQLDTLIFKVFLFVTKLFYLKNFNLFQFSYIKELTLLRKELKSALQDINNNYDQQEQQNREDIDFLKNLINESLLVLNNDSIIFNDFYKTTNHESDLNNSLNKFFLTINTYYARFFDQISCLNSSEKNLNLCKKLNIMEHDTHKNINVNYFQNNVDYVNQLPDKMIVIDFYVKQLKYFLHNLIFLSNFNDKKKIIKNEFYENFKNLFETYYLVIAFVGSYLYCTNLDEFLGVKKVGNFFTYDVLDIYNMKDTMFFFEKLNDYYNMNKNDDYFNIDNFINFMYEKANLIELPQELESVFNFIFLYNEYFLNKNHEKKDNKFLDNNFNKGFSHFNQTSCYHENFVNLKIEDNLKNNILKHKKTNDFKNFDLNFFVNFKKFCFECLNQKCSFSLGVKLNVHNIFFGGKISIDFESFKIFINYFFKSYALFSFSFKVYKNFSLICSFAPYKFSLGCDYFFNYDEHCIDLNLNYIF